MTTENKKAAYKLGWNGLQGIIKPGDAVCVASLSNNYKTATALSLICQIARFNKPQEAAPDKKPLILYFSAEETLNRKISLLFNRLKSSDVSAPLFHERVAYVQKSIGVNGYHIEPTATSLPKVNLDIVKDQVEYFESVDCPVEVLVLDGLNYAEEYGEPYSDICRFCKSLGITLIATAPLNVEAKLLLRHDVCTPENFLDAIAGKGYVERQADYNFDTILHTHIVRRSDKQYLAVKAAKNRNADSDSLKTFFLEFPQYSFIPDEAEDTPILRELPPVGEEDLSS